MQRTDPEPVASDEVYYRLASITLAATVSNDGL
jgi:hypothetical protein